MWPVDFPQIVLPRVLVVMLVCILCLVWPGICIKIYCHTYINA